MNMTRNISIFVFALAICVCSCEKEPVAVSDSMPIAFEVATSPVVTKATRYNNETGFSGQTFGMYAWNASNVKFYDNASVSKTGGVWAASSSTATWDAGSTYTFEAVYPKPAATLGTVGLTALTTASTPANLTFSYKIPTTTMSTEDKDFMLAYYQGVGIAGTNCRIAPLTFTHPLTCVNFKAGTMTGIASVKSIKISGVYQSGSCTVRTTVDGSSRQIYAYEQANTAHTSLWTPSGTTTVTGTSTVTVANLNNTVSAYNFLLIPQTITSTSNVNVTATLTNSGGTDVTVTATIPAITWRAGYYYTYQIGFTDNILTLNVITVAPWTSETINTPLS